MVIAQEFLGNSQAINYKIDIQLVMKPELRKNRPNLIDQKIRQFSRLALKNTIPGELLADKELSHGVTSYLKGKEEHLTWGTNEDHEKALHYSDTIIAIGEARNDPCQKALGLLSRGNIYAISGTNLQEAWEAMNESARLFRRGGDTIGWARTVISRLGICIELNKVKSTIAKAAAALKIFNDNGEKDLSIRLIINMSDILIRLGQYQKSIRILKQGIKKALTLKKMVKRRLGCLYNNIGCSFLHIGSISKAVEFYIKAEQIFIELKKERGIYHVRKNLAKIERLKGNYQDALAILLKILESYDHEISRPVIYLKMYMVECYLALNRYDEVKTLCEEIINNLTSLDSIDSLHNGHVQRFLGEAALKTGNYSDAEKYFSASKKIFHSYKSGSWLYYLFLLQAELAINRSDYGACIRLVNSIIAFYRKKRQKTNYVKAILLQLQCYLALGRKKDSAIAARTARKIIHKLNIPELKYRLLVLSGQTAEQSGQTAKAIGYYTKAIKSLEQANRYLTITIRHTFLEDKCDPLHGLMRIYLSQQKHKKALGVLTRFKSNNFFSYLNNRKRLYWSHKNPHIASLSRELHILQKEYHCLNEMAGQDAWLDDENPDTGKKVITQQMLYYEKKMNKIIEKLFLYSAVKYRFNPVNTPNIARIMKFLHPGALLLEYYNDGKKIWMFSITRNGIHIHKISPSSDSINRSIKRLRFNIDCALKAGPDNSSTVHLLKSISRLSRYLFKSLVSPLGNILKTVKQIYIVAYGLLHYLPFNILMNEDRYLVRDYEISMLPCSDFLSHTSVHHPGGKTNKNENNPCIRILAHSHHNRIPFTIAEARAIEQVFSSETYLEKEATLSRVINPPLKILHIAAHGCHRIDKPDFSFILLEDQRVYTNDFLQMNLDYELVTLSACDTGQLKITACEETIGLCRSILLAGAKAALLSLWKVDDETNAALIRFFYKSLAGGTTKSRALQQAQLSVLQENPRMHPAFWGAFQLFGHTDPVKQVVKQSPGVID